MNKKITLMVLVVVLAAMGLVFFTHMSSTPEQPLLEGQPGGPQPSPVSVDRDGRVSPVQPRPDTGSLTPIDPPVGGRDGVPRPVAVTAGQDPRAVRVVGSETGNATRSAQAEPAQAASGGAAGQAADSPDKGQTAAKPASRSPSLTPWELPPEKETKPQPGAGREAQAAKPKPADKPAQDKARQPVLSDRGSHTLKSISLQYAGQTMKLRIEADSDFPCKSFILTGPDRLVVDLPGAWKDMKTPAVPSNNVIKNARVGQQPAGPRLVLDLSRPIKGHTVQRSGKVVEILLQ